MYHDHFGLQRAPFRITPDTELFYPGGGRGEVLEALVYAVTSGEGIVKVTGEVGTGKTMLCRMLEVRLPSTVEVVYIANPSLSPEDILHAIALEMNLPVEAAAGRLQVMHSLQQRLLAMHAENRRVVVFVEEAQGMPMATLEEIRLLSNLETQRDKLLQIVLFGQPELDDALGRANIRQLRERITHSFRLDPLSRDEVREYVRFRMRAVGYRGPDVFKEGAYRQLARASEGLVRRVNILADKALLAAFADDTHNVTTRHMRVAIEDGSFGRPSGARVRWLAAVAALLLVAVGTLFALDNLPWQQWLRHYGLGDATLVSAPAAFPKPAAPVIAEQNIAPTTSPPPPDVAAVTEQRTPEPAPAEAVVAAVSETQPIVAPVAAVAKSSEPVSVAELPGSAPMVGAIAGVSLVSPESSASVTPPVVAVPVVEPQPAPAATTTVAVASMQPAPATKTRGAAVADDGAGNLAAAPMVTASAATPTARVEQQDAGGSDASAAHSAPAAPMVAAPGVASAVAESEAILVAAPAAPAPDIGSARRENPLLTERVIATHAWLREARGGNFCIQLLLADVRRQGSLEGFLQRMQRLDAYEKIYVYETVIGTRSWFGVLYGDFGSFDEARSALEALPEDLKRQKPFIRNVRDIVGQG